MHVLSLLQNKFGLVFFRLFDGALETSNFRFEEARSAITLLRCFLHENMQRGKIARVKFAEKLGTMSKNRLRWITLVRGPIWGIHTLTLMISWSDSSSTYTATVLWYFEALLIGIILPQFEGRFKHFLLVIRIIHTSRSFLQKQHQQFFFLASDIRQL